ncbi:MAG: hypothetical protein AB2598_20320 [Candidatus Thiodiazotropha sp.]
MAVVCKGCGRQLLGTESVCPECNTTLPVAQDTSPLEEWESEFNRVRMHWIIVVIIFWVTAAVTTGLFFIKGSAYLNELVFIAAIFMVLGVYLKTKVLRLQRKKPKA